MSIFAFPNVYFRCYASRKFQNVEKYLNFHYHWDRNIILECSKFCPKNGVYLTFPHIVGMFCSTFTPLFVIEFYKKILLKNGAVIKRSQLTNFQKQDYQEMKIKFGLDHSKAVPSNAGIILLL